MYRIAEAIVWLSSKIGLSQNFQKVSAESQRAVERISRGTSFPLTLEAEAALVLRTENFVAREMVSQETTL